MSLGHHGKHGTHGSGKMSNLVQADETYAIPGACFEVDRDMGCGFLEPVEQECLEMELALRDIPFEAQPQLVLAYKGRKLSKTYEPDFRCFGSVIVEIKAVTKLADEHRAQLHNYLRATGCRIGLLVNFGHHPLLEHERIIR
jgi:GxxExxY protein